MSANSRSKVAVVVIAIIALIVLVCVAVARWQDSPDGQPPAAGERVAGDEGSAQLEGWHRPVTTDAKAYASAYATAIWTYDTNQHDYFDWEDAVKLFADPMDSGTARVAGSMLPYYGQWKQLKLHGASATVSEVTAETPAALRRLADDPRTPAGWNGFVVRGRQTNVIDGVPRLGQRSVTVSVVCAPQCRFWSATSEMPT